MMLTHKHLIDLVRVQNTPLHVGKLSVVMGLKRTLSFSTIHRRVFPHLRKRWVQISTLLVLTKLIDLHLELLNFSHLADRLPLSLLTLKLESLNDLLQTFSLPPLTSQLTTHLLDLLQHLVKTLLHLPLPLRIFIQLLLEKMILELQLFDLCQRLLQLRSQRMRILLACYLQSIPQFVSSKRLSNMLSSIP